MSKQNIKLLPLNNPNFHINNRLSSLVELLQKEIPIVEEKSEKRGGFLIKQDNFILKDEAFWGDVFIYDDKEYEWTNVEMMIDSLDELNNVNITSLTAIYVKEKENGRIKNEN